MSFSFLDFFTDPVLKAPMIGSMLMCLASSLIGVISFVKRRSLLGETLSHAAYPGVVIGVLCAALLSPASDEGLAIWILVGAFISAFLGLMTINFLKKHVKASNDAALCFVLSVFFGIGILIASRLQFTHALWYKQIQVFLYGQAATMTDVHIGIYASLALAVFLMIFCFYKPIQAVSFDQTYAESIGIKVKLFEQISFVLLVLSIIVGIRSVGVVLMSGMLIAPAVAARQWTHSLSTLFILAGCFGLVSGFLGNYLSIALPLWFGDQRMALPTGPMILLTASFFCFVSLLFAPKRGLLGRTLRIARFKRRCRCENILKMLWKKGQDAHPTFSEIAEKEPFSKFYLKYLLFHLIKQGWVRKEVKNRYCLTSDGWRRAARIVRLHRLWEVYLVDYLGQQAGKVHRSAEEMEHILSPELEEELSELLQDPKQDPHQQPIPSAKEVLW